jgi:CRP-like cAMP-binding protein
LEKQPRVASAYANTDCELITFSQKNYEQILSQPSIVHKLTYLLSDRIWFLHKQLAHKSIPDINNKIYDMLAIYLEKEGVPPTQKEFTFTFSTENLFETLAINPIDGKAAIAKLEEEGEVSIVKDKIHVSHIQDIIRKNDLYWKLHH